MQRTALRATAEPPGRWAASEKPTESVLKGGVMISSLGWILFVVMGVTYLSFGRHMGRRVESLAEYVEFLLQNRAVYRDHREKYAAMLTEVLRESPSVQPLELATRAKRAIDSMAESLHKEVVLSNLFGRTSPEEWLRHDTVAEAKASQSNA
jgi:hypothetical protein